MPKKIITFTIPSQSIQKSVAYWGARGKARLELQEVFEADPFNCDAITFQLRESIKYALNDWDLELSSSTERYLSELVSNAYDSFSKFDLSQDKPLILKIVVKEGKRGNLCVKIMDNGAGFQDKTKGRYFFRKDFIPEDKDPSKNIGSSKIGLQFLEGAVKDMGGILFFKNRKEHGASVYLQLPAPILSKGCCSIS